MAVKEPTQEELNRLYSISAIPACAVFAIVIFYYSFFHLAQIYPPDSIMLDAFLYVFPPILIGMPVAFCLTFEVLYHRRMKSPAKFHVKRFLGRMVELLIFILFFTVAYLASYFFLAPVISESFAMICSFVIFVVVLGIAITKFKKFFDRLEKVKR